MLSIVSSFSHLSGHYWPYTVDLANAMTAEGSGVTVYAALPPRDGILDTNPLVSWKSCCLWTLLLKSIEQRNLSWSSRTEALLRNLEFSICLRRALAASENSHIHCIEARHRILLKAVLRSNRRFSALCVGSPAAAARIKLGDLYKRAFATGRLKFIVETEAVRRDWEDLAVEHVVHIPVALAERTEPMLSKQEARNRLGLPEEAFIALFFGTHREGKDYRTAIEAAKLAESHPYLLFAGPLISGNDPEALLKELEYDHAAVWNRYFLDDGASELFDACDVVMLPYAKGYEKGSAVLLQACKYGRPVIASDTGHLAEFVNAHQTGLLYELEEPQDLAAIYDSMAFAERNVLGKLEENIEKTRQEYSWGKLVSRYLGVFSPS